MRTPDPPHERPACPKCGFEMIKADIIPGMSFIRDRMFVCPSCGSLKLVEQQPPSETGDPT